VTRKSRLTAAPEVMSTDTGIMKECASGCLSMRAEVAFTGERQMMRTAAGASRLVGAAYDSGAPMVHIPCARSKDSPRGAAMLNLWRESCEKFASAARRSSSTRRPAAV